MLDVNSFDTIYGTNASDMVVLNQQTVADWEYTEWTGHQHVHHLWNGDYYAGDGHDVIIRDRPGIYRPYGGYGSDGRVETDASMLGGEGIDMISYAHYTGAIEIDLSTPVGYGVAKAKGLSGQEILGVDELHSIENATGTGFADLITGSNGANTLVGARGKDEIRGEGGNDRLHGGDHDDKLYGGSGNDTVKGENGNDKAWGGANNDIVEGGAGNDALYGDDGNDFLYGGTGSNALWGGSGNDTLLVEGSGRAYGDAGADLLVGGAAVDELHGGNENDILRGLAGNDKLYGDEGLDKLFGDAGNDTLVGGANSDDLKGGDGTDLAIWEGSARVVINIGRASVGTAIQSGFTDGLQGIENFRTGSGHDRIMAGAGANYIDSGVGFDWIDAAGGNDAVHAGDGNDYVLGGLGNDSLLGGDGDDQLSGEAGNDTLSGGDGEDGILGGAGSDTLFGGADADQFIFANGNTGIDSLRDFVLGQDMIRFDDFLADEPGIGESYVDEVYAMAADAGHSTALVGMTENGWQAFAKLVGYTNTAAINAAIADGTLFNPSLPNGDAPGDFYL